MDRAGIGYERRDNCFTHIDDLPRAQRIFDRLVQRRWFRPLNALARKVNPWLDPQAGLDIRGYDWTVRQDEYATDLMFKSAADLREVYPRPLDHAIGVFHSEDVLRFLGRRIQPARFNGEGRSTLQHRTEGTRVKHWVEENSIRMSDKQGTVLRIETTINNPRRLQGPSPNDPQRSTHHAVDSHAQERCRYSPARRDRSRRE